MKKIMIMASALAAITLHGGQVYHIKSDQELNSLLAQGKPVLLKFSKNGCSPCDVMKPVFEQMAQEIDDVIFISVHDDMQPQIARSLRSRYGAHSSPTIIVFDKNGKQIDKAVGGPMTARDVRIDLSGMISQAKGKKMMPSSYPYPPNQPQRPMNQKTNAAPTNNVPYRLPQQQPAKDRPYQPQRPATRPTPTTRPTTPRTLKLQCEVIEDNQ